MRNKEMNYKEAVNYIDRLQMFAKKHSLDHTRVFLSYLGMPQREKKIIHVAGTNGKGSVCRYLQALLTRRGEEDGTVYFPSSCYDPGADPYRRRNDIRRTICPDI